MSIWMKRFILCVLLLQTATTRCVLSMEADSDLLGGTRSGAWSIRSPLAKAAVVVATAGLIGTTSYIIATSVPKNNHPLPSSINGTVGITPWQSVYPQQNESSWNSTTGSEFFGVPPTDSCFAPTGVWGNVCTSRIGLQGQYPDTMISYSFDELDYETAVFCKVLGAACDGFGYSCCFTLHPRAPDAGNPVWLGDIEIVWGYNWGTPQIQCYSAGPPIQVRWGWSAGKRGKFGCFNGYDCKLQPNGC